MKYTLISIGMAIIIFALGVVVGTMITGRTNLSAQGTPAALGQAKVTADGGNPVVQNGSAVAFTISITNLPDTQKSFLRTMGITGDTIPVTNTMLACAQVSVGTDRMTAIKNGATPSVGEGIKLAGCYKK